MNDVKLLGCIHGDDAERILGCGCQQPVKLQRYDIPSGHWHPGCVPIP